MAAGIVNLNLLAVLVEIGTVTKCWWMSCSLVDVIMDIFKIKQIFHVLVDNLNLFYSQACCNHPWSDLSLPRFQISIKQHCVTEHELGVGDGPSAGSWRMSQQAPAVVSQELDVLLVHTEPSG